MDIRQSHWRKHITEADTMDEIKMNIKEVVECHFDPEKMPKLIRLHMIKEEIIAV